MSDDHLIHLCQKGDEAAFESLLSRHYQAIYQTAWRWCGNADNAQDITQNVCLKLAHSINSFKFKSSFATWLYRLTINCAKDFYKSPTQYNQREESSDHLTELSKTQDAHDERIQARQMLEKISELPNELAETLILVFVNGLSHAQIADQSNVKESTVSWRVHEARKQLKLLCEQAPQQKQDQPALSGGTL